MHELTNMSHQMNNTTASSVEYETDNTTGNAASLMYIEHQMQLIQSFYFWWHIIIIPVGIVGNVLCLLVMLQKQNRSISCSVYMGALAVADTIHLLIKGFSAVAFPELSNVIEETATLLCKVTFYCLFTSSQCGVLIILAFLMERVIAVRKPMKAAIILSPKRALIISFIIVAFASLFNIPFIFVASIVKVMETVRCAPDTPGKLGYVIHSMVGLLINGVLPLVIILVVNLMILYTIKSSKAAFGKRKKTKEYHTQARERITSVSGTKDILEMTDDTTVTSGELSVVSRSRSQRERQLTVMTVAMTLAFLLCTMPMHVFGVVWTNIEYQRSVRMQIMFELTGCIVQSLVTLNCAINFYLYILTGSKFRSDLKMLFRCCRRDLG